MKFLRGAAIVAALLFFRSGVSADLPDPLWMFVDSTVVYGDFRYCDTARNVDVLCHALLSDQLPDTGDSYNGTHYIDFNYQFNINPVIVKDVFDTTAIIYQDSPRPGYAGFKTAWDMGMIGFPLPRYKYLIFAHHGPLQNHKVTVNCWYTDGGCGSPSYPDYLGTFTSSTTWRVDTIVIPDSIQNRSDIARNFKYYELVFIINNADPNDTNKTSAPGFLRIDNIRLSGLSTTRAVMPRPAGMRTFLCSGPARVLRYTLPSTCRVSIRYYDVSGRLVASFVDRTQGAGEYSLSVPVSQWAKGAYLQVFEAGNYTSKRMVTGISRARF